MAGTKAKTVSKAKAKNDFPKKTWMFWYESMLLVRRFEEKAGQLYGQQKIRGFCHLYIGQEAVASGSVSALKEGDKYITAYRDHGHPLVLGSDPGAVMAELFAKSTGISKGKGGSMHMFDKEKGFFGGHGIVGAQIPLGAGIAFAEQYKGNDNVCICYMGDGAVRQGAFHETLNMAMTFKIPVIFAIENNGYAMGTSVERTSNVTELYQLGEAYSMPSFAVDAMSVISVHNAVQEAANRARKGDGPTLLELRTYRYKGHSMSDPAKYRTRDEVDEYRKKDPIEQVKSQILKSKIAPEKELQVIEEKIKSSVEAAVKFAEESPLPDPSEAMHDVYKEPNYPFTTD